MRILCPHCQQRVEVLEDDPLVEVDCPSCGSSFSLVGGPGETTFSQQARAIGHFQLLNLIGRGAFGSVWEAHDTELDRHVAVKLPRNEQLSNDEAEHFLREARAAAQLRHPNLVSVHEVGRDESGQLYIVSDFIQGATLAQWLESKTPSIPEAVELMVCVSEAVQHAHHHGVIHRDLKPENILMDANGVPHITDFGLAKREAGEVTMTVDGKILGTPAYMSPEQARGEGHRVDGRTDIYSLGVVLFQLLTGELPFRGGVRMLILQILNDEPPGPRSLSSGISRDLNTITLKCLEKDPSKRYPTADELAADLKRWLNGEPIKARPISSLERSLRWCRRNPAIAALTAGVAVLLLVVAVGSVVYSYREHRARTAAEAYLRLTLDVIDELLSEIGDQSLAHVPHMEAVRKRLLQKAVKFHQQLLESKPANATVRLEFARAHHRMANLYELLGEHDRAQAAYLAAIELFDELSAAAPHDDRVRHHLAVSYTMLGEVFRKTAAHEQARRYYDQALQLQQELYQQSPANQEVRRELSRTLNNRGLLHTEIAQFPAAEADLMAAIEHLQALTRAADAADLMADLGRSQINLGLLLKQQSGRDAEAQATYQAAIRQLEQLVERDSKNREHQYKLAVAMLDLGNLLMRVPDGMHGELLDERRRQSVRWTRRANSTLSTVCTKFPGIPLYWYELANSHNSLANALAGQSDFGATETQFEQAQQTLDLLEQRFPGYAQSMANFQSLRGIVLGGRGWIEFVVREDPEAAQPLVKRAITHQQRATNLAPANPTFCERLAGNHLFLAQIQEKLGLSESARENQRLAEQQKAEVESMKRGDPGPAEAEVSSSQ